MENVIFAWNILKVALGLGFVIFLHELGHFLLAKWNGVKVEKFSIGFGPTLASFRRGVGLRVGANSRPPGPGDPPTWGETEYLLAALPLGGYVKMLGENAEGSTDEAPGPDDPRAYNNKSVWARMQIITAGVIMNVILGWACFTYVYTQGVTDRPAKIGGVSAGSPAYKAGLRAGDEIVAIDGRRDISYKDLLGRINLSGAGQKIKFLIRRPGVKDEIPLEIEPLRDGNDPVPTIGIYSAQGLEFAPKPMSFRAMPGQSVDKAHPNPGFDGEDKVLAVGPEGEPLEPVEEHVDLVRKLAKFRDRPLAVEVERKKPEGNGTAARARLTVPTHRFLDFGLRLAAGPIVAIRPDSPARKAGLEPGDRIEQVDSHADYDPMRLPDYAFEHADRPIALVVVRIVDGKETKIEATVTPDASPIWADPVEPTGRLAPLDVPGLGLALAIGAKVEAVAEGSPAAKAGIKAGDSLRSIVLTLTKDEDEKTRPKPVTIPLDGKVNGWPLAFASIQEHALDSVELTTDKSDRPIKVMPEVDPSRFHSLRGLGLQALLRKLPPLGLVEAGSRGWEETVDNIYGIFRLFRGMAQGRVGGDAVGGVIPIAKIAYSSASMGWTPFIFFLGILSVNLAVLNFLPIPPLDGGQFCLLTIEKVRGRPLSESAQNVVMIAGLVFVLGLILIINGRDIFKQVQSFF